MWDTKYRPLRFEDVLGQRGTVDVLKARLRAGSAFESSYIFSGGSGQGKTTLARIFARAMLCTGRGEDPEPCNECDSCRAFLDDTSVAFVERDAGSQGTVDDVRAILEELPFAVFGAPKRIYLFDECHRMSVGAQDALLKPIEDGDLVGIFCTTEPEKIRAAIRGRCEPYVIRKVTPDDLVLRAKYVLDKEGVSYEEEAVRAVVDSSGGHVRDVLKRLESVAQLGSVTFDLVEAHLNLGLHSTYYRILLEIPSAPREALVRLDEVLERVTPEEAASGLAEAAMQSFRLANNMVADFTYVDKGLGLQVHALYGPGLVEVAEYFLRSRAVSKVSLVCDVVSLAKGVRGGGAPPKPAPPVITLASPEPASPPPAAVPEPPAPAVVPEPPAPPVPASPPPSSKSPPRPGLRPDGVGNLGQDPAALTDFDKHVVPTHEPKGNHERIDLNFSDTPGSDAKRVLNPNEWREQFLLHLRLGNAHVG